MHRGFGLIIEKGEYEIFKESVIEKEESNNQGDQEERGFPIGQLIDKKNTLGGEQRRKSWVSQILNYQIT